MSILSHIVALEVGNLEKGERIAKLEAENACLKEDVTMIAVKARDARIAQLESEKDAISVLARADVSFAAATHRTLEKRIEKLVGELAGSQCTVSDLKRGRDALSAKLAQVEVSFAGASYRALERRLEDQRQIATMHQREMADLKAENARLKENQWTRDVYESIAKEGLPGQRVSQVIGSIIRERDSIKRDHTRLLQEAAAGADLRDLHHREMAGLKAHVVEVEKLGSEFVLKVANLQRDKETLEQTLKSAIRSKWNDRVHDSIMQIKREDELVSNCIVRMVKEHGELTKRQLSQEAIDNAWRNKDPEESVTDFVNRRVAHNCDAAEDDRRNLQKVVNDCYELLKSEIA